VSAQPDQVLWTGWGRRNEIESVGPRALSRYFELLDVVEQNVAGSRTGALRRRRSRQLVALAQDNHVQHRLALDKIQSASGPVVGRGWI